MLMLVLILKDQVKVLVLAGSVLETGASISRGHTT